VKNQMKLEREVHGAAQNDPKEADGEAQRSSS
jgi:hypothetical protein